MTDHSIYNKGSDLSDDNTMTSWSRMKKPEKVKHIEKLKDKEL